MNNKLMLNVQFCNTNASTLSYDIQYHNIIYVAYVTCVYYYWMGNGQLMNNIIISCKYNFRFPVGVHSRIWFRINSE